MRDAAQRGAFQLVAQRRIEFDQMPARLWAAGYKAVHSELVAAKADPPGRRLRETQCLEEQAGCSLRRSASDESRTADLTRKPALYHNGRLSKRVPRDG